MSVLKVEVPGWGTRRQVEYGAEIRVTRESGVIALEANDAGFLELALETLLLAGPGVPEGTWVEIDEYGGVLAEGSMPLILTRTGSTVGEMPAPWILPMDSDCPGVALKGLGVGVTQGELAICGDGAALAEFGRCLLIVGSHSDLLDIGSLALKETALTCETGGVVLRRAESTVDIGLYPAVWEVLFEHPEGCREGLDYEVDDDGRHWMSARALRALDGLLSDCRLVANAPGGPAQLVSVPAIDCLCADRASVYGELRAEAKHLSSALDRCSLKPEAGLFSIVGEPKGRLFATNSFVDRAMRSRLLGFTFRVSWTSGRERSPRLLRPVSDRDLGVLSPAPFPIKAVTKSDKRTIGR